MSYKEFSSEEAILNDINKLELLKKEIKKQKYGLVGGIITMPPQNEALTLRDQFAIAALNGCLSHSDKGNVTFNSVKDATDYYAKLAYAYADAMLAARGK
ncbi:hypothetical protein [Providencia sp. PROV260]|uniref:hypothetical protein n=1 Tax=Providencia sp. PROV260 TaxID=2949948 RepID=UPI00234A413F|nr:hypothetical protein [Providencia sp. PROV260]